MLRRIAYFRQRGLIFLCVEIENNPIPVKACRQYYDYIRLKHHNHDPFLE